jgi:hypothetical protein
MNLVIEVMSQENRGIVAQAKFFAKTDFTRSISRRRLLKNHSMLAFPFLARRPGDRDQFFKTAGVAESAELVS